MSFLLRTHWVKKKKLSAKHIESIKKKKPTDLTKTLHRISTLNSHGDPWGKRLIIVKLICTITELQNVKDMADISV